MKLRESAENLINDYWTTAKSEQKQKTKSWNSLDYDEQQLLIRYWGYEKTRMENNYLTTAEQLETQSQTYLKELELAKFHEERGKINCLCYACESKLEKEIKQKKQTDKEKCPECGRWVKELDEENGICKKCMESYE